MIFVDESGFDLSPHVSRGWAPVGRTPVVKFPLRAGRLSAISGVTIEGEVYFRMYEGSIKAHHVAVFVRQILRLTDGPVDIIWDGIATHRALEVKTVLNSNWPRLQIHRFPAYAPELNPDEYFWNWLKNKVLVNLACSSLEDLRARLRKAVVTIRRFPELINSFFLASPLSCH